MKYINIIVIAFSALTLTQTALAKNNNPDKSYTEYEFIKIVNGKTKEQVLNLLGKPARKTTPAMPTDAPKIVHEKTKITPIKSKDNIEMWHYNKLVNYNKKDKYNRTELTFINDRCSNITYIN